MLTVADRGRGKICQNLADVICERSLDTGYFLLGNHQIMYTIYLQYQFTNTGK